MKHTIMKYTRWHLQWSVRLICVSAAMLFFVLSAQAQTDAPLRPIGGSGGGVFTGRCPRGELLTGVKLRAGDWVDAIRPICVTVYGPAEAGPIIFFPYLGMFGGSGGNPQDLLCPRDAPIVTAMYIFAEGVDTITVSHINLFCGLAATNQKPSEFPAAAFDGPKVSSGTLSSRGYSTRWGRQQCPAGLVAVGINGWSGEWLDAVGLICGPLKLTPKAVPPPEVPPSPAVKAIGRKKVPGTSPGTPTTAPARPICDVAQEARARNNAAAPGLEESCRAELAAKGAAIAAADQEVAEARMIEADESYQRGFDIATGIFGDPALGAKGNTATGPGSLGIRDSLSAAGQTGFNASVKLHLNRKYERTSATITASPNPVMVPTGQASGATTISWKVPQGYTYCEIYLSIDNGQWSEFARGGDGTKATTIKLGSSQTFRMIIYEGQEGTPKVITTLTVTAPKN